MIRLTLTASPLLAVLLLCGSPSRIEASGNTPITIKDGGSILLIVEGLDAAKDWKISPGELRHLSAAGVLNGLKVTDGGADRCAGDPKCGINPSKPWKIQVIYNSRSVTIASVSANQGVHVKFSGKIPLNLWQKAGTDQREFGHGDGRHISSIKVNGSATSLCSGKGACEMTVTYTVP